MRPTQVFDAIAVHQPTRLALAGDCPSAVLVPLRTDGCDLEVVLTRRASGLVSHSGQVSFPGGHVEAEDADAVAAALRETHEELGVVSSAVRVIGRLSDVRTLTGYHISPIVGVLESATPFVLDTTEVARVFTVPLAFLQRHESWKSRRHHYGELAIDSWHVPWDGEDIWGVTAYILRTLVELLWRVGAACGG